MSIESITVFKPTGVLNKVWLMWEVVKTFYSLSDEAHLERIAGLEKQIKEQFDDSTRSEEKFRAVASLADKRNLADLSGNILVRAAILHLQTAFIEFAVKEVFKLVLPDRTIPRKPQFFADLIKPLKEAGAFTGFPREYLDSVSKYWDAVRNQYAHGDWFELAKEVKDLDLVKAFEGTAKLMEHFQTNLRRIRPNEYYKVLVGGEWFEEKTEHQPKIWKFLVEVPESLESSHQNRAITAARNVGGTELRNDMNFPHGSWAKLFLVDPAKLNFTSCVVSDDCKVWIVEKPNGFKANPFLDRSEN
jgi:hypothetical protein